MGHPIQGHSRLGSSRGESLATGLILPPWGGSLVLTKIHESILMCFGPVASAFSPNPPFSHFGVRAQGKGPWAGKHSPVLQASLKARYMSRAAPSPWDSVSFAVKQRKWSGGGTKCACSLVAPESHHVSLVKGLKTQRRGWYWTGPHIWDTSLPDRPATSHRNPMLPLE